MADYPPITTEDGDVLTDPAEITAYLDASASQAWSSGRVILGDPPIGYVLTSDLRPAGPGPDITMTVFDLDTDEQIGIAVPEVGFISNAQLNDPDFDLDAARAKGRDELNAWLLETLPPGVDPKDVQVGSP